MPRKKVTKKTPRTDADAVAEALETVDGTAAVSAILSEVRSLTTKLDELSKENDQLRDALLQNPSEGGRKIVSGKDAFEVPQVKEPPAAGTYAVFRSTSMGLQQKLVKSKKERYADGESEIVPPVFASFDKGVCVLYEEDEIKLMRERAVLNKKMGKPIFVEITDSDQKESALKGELSGRVIKSQTVTVETALEELAV